MALLLTEPLVTGSNSLLTTYFCLDELRMVIKSYLTEKIWQSFKITIHKPQTIGPPAKRPNRETGLF